jgi:GNAT superfamily N-acetyltransferase
MTLPDGYHDLPPGRIASIVTYLEMRMRPEAAPLRLPPGISIELQRPPDPGAYRRLFRAVGEDWLWFSRLAMPDEELSAILNHPAVDVFYLKRDGCPIGLLELDRRSPPAIEITFLGLIGEETGRGLGGVLMSHAIHHSWRHQPSRLWLHTCTLDHPGALGFYQHFGFVPYRRAVEVAPDPRLTGNLPATSAPQIAVLK